MRVSFNGRYRELHRRKYEVKSTNCCSLTQGNRKVKDKPLAEHLHPNKTVSTRLQHPRGINKLARPVIG